MRPADTQPPANETIQAILAAVRESGLSLRELEELSGVQRTTIANFLRGKVPQGVENLLALGKAVGVTVVAKRRRPKG